MGMNTINKLRKNLKHNNKKGRNSIRTKNKMGINKVKGYNKKPKKMNEKYKGYTRNRKSNTRDKKYSIIIKGGGGDDIYSEDEDKEHKYGLSNIYLVGERRAGDSKTYHSFYLMNLLDDMFIGIDPDEVDVIIDGEDENINE